MAGDSIKKKVNNRLDTIINEKIKFYEDRGWWPHRANIKGQKQRAGFQSEDQLKASFKSLKIESPDRTGKLNEETRWFASALRDYIIANSKKNPKAGRKNQLSYALFNKRSCVSDTIGEILDSVLQRIGVDANKLGLNDAKDKARCLILLTNKSNKPHEMNKRLSYLLKIQKEIGKEVYLPGNANNPEGKYTLSKLSLPVVVTENSRFSAVFTKQGTPPRVMRTFKKAPETQAQPKKPYNPKAFNKWPLTLEL